MKTITLPIGATADTLIRRICEQLRDVDTHIFDNVPHGDAAGVIHEFLRARPDVKLEWT